MSPIFNPSPPATPQAEEEFPELPESMRELDYDEWHAHIADSDDSAPSAAQSRVLPTEGQQPVPGTAPVS